MLRGLLVRRRLLSGCACAVLVMVTSGAGCSTTAPAPTVSGKTLTVYLSAPAKLVADQQAQDLLNAQRLAFHPGCTAKSCAPIHIGSFTVALKQVTANKVSDNARTAISDTSSIAYLGEVQPGTSLDSLGITNAQDVLQVSPIEGPPVPQKAFQSYSTYGRTFASMNPISAGELPGMVGGPAYKAFVRDFRSAYGQAPSTQAVEGYAAMSAVLKALQKAGSSATNRGTVVSDFFALKNVALPIGQGGPVLGTYTVNKGGTVTITPASG